MNMDFCNHVKFCQCGKMSTSPTKSVLVRLAWVRFFLSYGHLSSCHMVFIVEHVVVFAVLAIICLIWLSRVTLKDLGFTASKIIACAGLVRKLFFRRFE